MKIIQEELYTKLKNNYTPPGNKSGKSCGIKGESGRGCHRTSPNKITMKSVKRKIHTHPIISWGYYNDKNHIIGMNLYIRLITPLTRLPSPLNVLTKTEEIGDDLVSVPVLYHPLDNSRQNR